MPRPEGELTLAEMAERLNEVVPFLKPAEPEQARAAMARTAEGGCPHIHQLHWGCGLS